MDIKGLIADIAPSIASAVGGPLAGKAVGAILDAFGITDVTELEAAVKNATPEQIIALKNADNEFKLAYLNAEVKDKADARAMQAAALGQTDLLSKRFVYGFAVYWSVVASVYIACITFIDIPTTSVRFADTILGFLLGTIITTIIQFFYGSSYGSRLKDEKKL